MFFLVREINREGRGRGRRERGASRRTVGSSIVSESVKEKAA